MLLVFDGAPFEEESGSQARSWRKRTQKAQQDLKPQSIQNQVELARPAEGRAQPAGAG
jgi:hypothetical protein